MLDVDDFLTFKALCANQFDLVVELAGVSTSGLSGNNLERRGLVLRTSRPRC